MSTITITYRRCDGCGRSELFDDIEIVRSKRRYPYLSDSPTTDMCNICYEEDKYICRFCHEVHGDDDACDLVKEMKEEPQWQ